MTSIYHDAAVVRAGRAAGPADTPVCQCCPRRLKREELSAGRGVCWLCEDRIASGLQEIRTLWPRLSEVVHQGAAPREEGMPKPPSGPDGSTAPGNLEAYDLLAGGVTGPLLAREDEWRAELRRHDPRWPLTPHRGGQDQTVAGVLEFLGANLRWACGGGYSDVDDLDTDVRLLVRRMTAVVNNDRRRPCTLKAPCPLPSRTDPSGTCGGELVYEPVPEAVIRCGLCKQRIGYQYWTDLVDAAGLLAA
ncbi:hypothetical protein [Streptomyces sp. NRRL S-350]|uniref:hypothetical protein n=1 Tax=Streptomyces sp. NRRL S-350 TaxID=1463902 RepID=UPI001F1D474F|nr:hypothetical protein [Streptomyces sp. NRRL S-350]